MKQDLLLEKANLLPTKPGCYLMKNKHGEVIYVGKAKSLKARVTSYFNQSQKNTKTTVLVNHIDDFEFIIVSTEAEALVLENNLIKQHTPKYNIRLKDDKSYPYIIIDSGHTFPRLQYTRKWKRQKNLMAFGPYTTGSNIKEVCKIVRKNLLLRDCADTEFAKRKTPCLLYQIKQCSAPCVEYITAEEYQRDLHIALEFLKGKPTAFFQMMSEKMMGAAELEQFELAATLRDELALVRDFSEQAVQRHAEDLQGERDLDVIGFSTNEGEVDLSIFMVRQGILLGSKNYHFECDDLQSIDDQLSSFLMQYYSRVCESLPKRLVLPLESAARESIKLALNLIFSDQKISVSGVQSSFASLANLVADQAKEAQRVRLLQQQNERQGLIQLQKILGMADVPTVLECYDIAVWSGKSPTASQIVFHQGMADKQRYRYYHLQERPEGNNDFAMLKEVLVRRLKHGSLPDVLVVDGGMGQVNVFVQVLKELEISLPVVGLAKERSKRDFKAKEVIKSEERLILPGQVNSISLKKYPALMKILVQMRDEAHRFSRKLHHHQEKKRILGED